MLRKIDKPGCMPLYRLHFGYVGFYYRVPYCRSIFKLWTNYGHSIWPLLCIIGQWDHLEANSTRLRLSAIMPIESSALALTDIGLSSFFIIYTRNKLGSNLEEVVSLQEQTSPYFQLREK